MLTKEQRNVVKEAALADIRFNLNGHATYSQAKQIIKVCRAVLRRCEAS